MLHTSAPSAGDDGPIPVTVDDLVPHRSRRSTILIVATLCLALALTWISPPLLRPTVFGSSWGGSSVVGRGDVVFTEITLEPNAWGARLESVSGLPGATVENAWLAHRSGSDELALRPPPNRAAAEPSELGLTPGDELPAKITTGEVSLVVQWRITDCAALTAADRPTVTVRAALGYRVAEAFPQAFSLDDFAILDPDRSPSLGTATTSPNDQDGPTKLCSERR